MAKVKPSDKPAAAAANSDKNNKSASGVKEDGTNLIGFNQQTFLLDLMGYDPEKLGVIFKDKSAPAGSPATTWKGIGKPQIVKASDDFTNVTGDNYAKFQEFLTGLTPREYAQIIPTFKIQVVDARTGMVIGDFPLTEPSNIAKGNSMSLKTGHYYSGNAVGLKSLDMEIDGQTNPLTGRIYNITIQLLFDSINTFLGQIPGTKHSYSDVLRAVGPASGGHTSNGKAYLRLTIAYSTSNKDIQTKYNMQLGSPLYSFTSYLNFIKSDLEIDENLKTTVKAKFMAHEESLISNNEIFNWLLHDGYAKPEREAIQKELKDAEEKLAGKIKEQKAKLKKARARRARSIFAGTPPVGTMERTLKNEMKRRAHKAGLGPARGGWDAVPDHKVRNWKKGLGPEAHDKLFGRGAKTGAVQQYDKEYLEYVKGNRKEPPHLDLRALGITDGKVISDYERARKKLEMNVIKDSSEINEEIKRLQDEYKTLRQTKLASLNNIRINFIGDIIEEEIFGREDYIYTVQVDSIELQEYLDSIRSDKVKDYFERKDSPAARGAKRAPKRRKSMALWGLERNADKAKINYIKIRLDVVRKQIRDYEAVLDKKRLAAKRDRTKRGHTKRVYVDQPPFGPLLKDLRQQEKKLQEELKSVSKNLFVGQTAEQLEKRLQEFKIIKFMRLGDLLNFVLVRVNHLNRDGKFGDNLDVKRTVLIMGDIILENILTKGQTERFNLADIPISIDVLRKMFSDRLVGTMKTTFTVLELLNEVVNILRLSQKRKSVLLGKASFQNNFTAQYYTYPVNYEASRILRNSIDGKGANIDNWDKRNGVYIFARDDKKQNLANLGGNFISNMRKNVPHFFFGGASKGAQKKIKITEHSNTALKKAAFEMNQGAIAQGTANGHIPIFFTVELTLVGCPWFQIGSYFYLESPTIDKSNSKSWFFLDGYYTTYKLSHTYKAGGSYETRVIGKLQLSKQQIDGTRGSPKEKANSLSTTKQKAKKHKRGLKGP